jgi:hypothetical protein
MEKSKTKIRMPRPCGAPTSYLTPTKFLKPRFDTKPISSWSAYLSPLMLEKTSLDRQPLFKNFYPWDFDG